MIQEHEAEQTPWLREPRVHTRHWRHSIRSARERASTIADDRFLAVIILTSAVALVVGEFWPGHINWDTKQIVDEARGGAVLDWWSGVGTLLLRAWFTAGLGLPLVWTAAVMMTVIGAYACVRVALRRVSAATVTFGMSYIRRLTPSSQA
jgi:hypothetical protein